MHSRKLINWITKTNTRSLVKLADRPKLPGSNGKGFPALLNEPPKTFPYKIRAQDHGVNEDTSPGKCADALRCENHFFLNIKIRLFHKIFLTAFA